MPSRCSWCNAAFAAVQFAALHGRMWASPFASAVDNLTESLTHARRIFEDPERSDACKAVPSAIPVTPSNLLRVCAHRFPAEAWQDFAQPARTCAVGCGLAPRPRPREGPTLALRGHEGGALGRRWRSPRAKSSVGLPRLCRSQSSSPCVARGARLDSISDLGFINCQPFTR